MGFLRKIGKKIKKGVKKLFSTPLGRIAGTIGLYLAVGAAAKSMTGWWQSTFGKIGEQAATEAATTAATETAAKQTVGEGLKSAVSNATTNSEAANIAMNAVDVGVKEGTANLVVDNTITGSLDKINTELFMPDTQFLLETGKEASKTLTDYSFAELDIGQQIKKVGTEAVEYVGKRVPEDYVEKGLATGLTGAITGYFQEEPEEPFYPGSPAPRRSPEQAQAAYIQDMSSQWMAANNTSRVPDFNQVMQQNFYGTSSPQYLQQFNQGIAPQMLPLPQV